MIVDGLLFSVYTISEPKNMISARIATDRTSVTLILPQEMEKEMQCGDAMSSKKTIASWTDKIIKMLWQQNGGFESWEHAFFPQNLRAGKAFQKPSQNPVFIHAFAKGALGQSGILKKISHTKLTSPELSSWALPYS